MSCLFFCDCLEGIGIRGDSVVGLCTRINKRRKKKLVSTNSERIIEEERDGIYICNRGLG